MLTKSTTMLLGEPQRTNYDISFELFRFPIRIHPTFFILPLFLSLSHGDVLITLIFVTVFFVSILVHELGHAFSMRYFGSDARVVLYGMGGLAIPDTNPWQTSSKSSFSSGQQIMVSFAGPFAGFVLAAIVGLVIKLLGGDILVFMNGVIPSVVPDYTESKISGNENLMALLSIMIWINIYLNLLNLIPVYPLDGGQIARQFFVMGDAWNGVRNSLILSLVTGAVVALFMFANRETFIGILFALLAYGSWMSLQQYRSGGFGGRPW